MLNNELTIGYVPDSGVYPGVLVFKPSVIEGQRISEDSVRDVITVIEHLIKPIVGVVPAISSSARPAPAQIEKPPSTPAKQLLAPVASSTCPACHAPVAESEGFCGSCGHKVP